MKHLDKNGLTAEQWAEELFECELCPECGGDIEDHHYTMINGEWFAQCRIYDDKQAFKYARYVVEICGFDIDDKANLDKLRAVTYCLQDMVR